MQMSEPMSQSLPQDACKSHDQLNTDKNKTRKQTKNRLKTEKKTTKYKETHQCELVCRSRLMQLMVRVPVIQGSKYNS